MKGDSELSEHHTNSDTVIGWDDLPFEGEHLFQLTSEAIVQPGVEERVTAGGAHSKPVAEQLDQEKVVLVNQVDVYVTDDVEDMDGEPADGKGSHHQHKEAEDLSPPHAIKLRLALRRVARHHTIL